ncbi:MAG: aminopeptidase P family N-terminal domain-containing protein, partial [Proteobacteria bacterium]|nr:aminopeptidase P family N-terminal domain-containing protein [Pseudomonadota bacterium]
MTRDQKIQALRHLMKQSNIAAIIVSGQDPHGSEYVAEHWQTRKWLTGFSGSAGTAVVTLNQAVLWTDSRYYIQAQEQILESGFVLFKTGQPDVPDVQNWLEDNLMQNDIVGLDGSVFSLAGIKKLESGLNARGIV